MSYGDEALTLEERLTMQYAGDTHGNFPLFFPLPAFSSLCCLWVFWFFFLFLLSFPIFFNPTDFPVFSFSQRRLPIDLSIILTNYHGVNRREQNYGDSKNSKISKILYFQCELLKHTFL